MLEMPDIKAGVKLRRTLQDAVRTGADPANKTANMKL
jgi:hypothetical protein